MSDGIDSFDKRIRELEKITSNVDGKVTSTNSQLLELNRLIREALTTNAEELREISSRTMMSELKVISLEKSLDKTEDEVKILKENFITFEKGYGVLYAQHTSCQMSRTKFEDMISDLTGRMAPIEMALNDLSEKSKKTENVIWKWTERLIMVIVQAILLITLLHYSEIANKMSSSSEFVVPTNKQTQQFDYQYYKKKYNESELQNNLGE